MIAPLQCLRSSLDPVACFNLIPPMGESFNTIRLLEPPFDFVDERVIFIPRGRRLEVNNLGLKFILFFEGSAELTVDGQPMGRVGKGDVLVVPRFCRQLYVPTNRRAEERLHIMRIMFDPALLRGNADLEHEDDRPEPDPDHEFSAFIRRTFKAVRILSGGLSGRLLELVKLIREESERADAGHRFCIGAYCRLLVMDAARQIGVPDKQWRGSESADGDSASWIIEHTKQFLFENYARSLTLSEIAWEVKLSGEHLCRSFREKTGKTVFTYLRDLRIEAAKSLLTSSKLKVTEIATRCGFGSSSVFSRTFQKIVGQTPVEYRRRASRKILFQPTTLQPMSRFG